MNTCLPKVLNKKCDGSHNHAPCVGRDTLFTQGYTPSICKVIHQAISRDIQSLAKIDGASCQGQSSASQSLVLVAIDVLAAVDHSRAVRASSAKAVCAPTLVTPVPSATMIPVLHTIRKAWTKAKRVAQATNAGRDVELGSTDTPILAETAEQPPSPRETAPKGPVLLTNEIVFFALPDQWSNREGRT